MVAAIFRSAGPPGQELQILVTAFFGLSLATTNETAE